MLNVSPGQAKDGQQPYQGFYTSESPVSVLLVKLIVDWDATDPCSPTQSQICKPSQLR